MEYREIMEEYTRNRVEEPVIFRSPRRRAPVQRKVKDVVELGMSGDSPLEAEWTDAAGYHRAPVTGMWESENGAVVMTVSAGRVATERDNPPGSEA